MPCQECGHNIGTWRPHANCFSAFHVKQPIKDIGWRHGRTTQAVQTHARFLGRGVNAGSFQAAPARGIRRKTMCTPSDWDCVTEGTESTRFGPGGIVARGCEKVIGAPVTLGTAGAVDRETRHREVEAEWGDKTTAPVHEAFHVKQRRQAGCRLRISSATRFCKSLGETPGILAACPRDVGRIRSSFSRASKEMVPKDL